MNILKQCLTAAILLLYLPTIAQHSYSTQKNNADSAWVKLNDIIGAKGTSNDFLATQNRFLKYREEGLKFWKMFPNDSRRYQWFYCTMYYGYINTYLKIEKGDNSYKSILKVNERELLPSGKSYSWPLNKKSLDEWENIYPQLKRDFLSYTFKNSGVEMIPRLIPGSSYEFYLSGCEINNFFSLSFNKNYRKGSKIDLNRLRDLFLSSGKLLEKMDSTRTANSINSIKMEVFGPMESLIDYHAEFGLNTIDLNAFLNSIKSSTVPMLRDWAIQKSNVFALMQEPLSLRHPSINGDTIDLEEMRGKVVLVDFWSTGCSNCIARMPAIKAVYDKYKSKGFAVVSACLNSGDEIKRIKEIEEKIGADWPILLIGSMEVKDYDSSLGKKIWSKYGFWGVPQLLLLNKQGKLVMLNDKLQSGDFEPLVQQLLLEDYKAN